MDLDTQLNQNQEEKQQDESLLKNQPSYKQKEYWNERYKVKETYYDWYCGYPELKLVFEQCYNLKKDSKILMIGCGNSKLSEDMFDDGYSNIISTDISDVVIDQLKRDAEKKNKNMIFEIQDCTNLTYDDYSFDFVFDKGTLDALSCDVEGGSVNLMLKEMTRVCKKSGSAVIASFGLLHERRFMFYESLGFDKFTYQLCKKYLSIDAQLTNIMRHVSNGLPMPLILKNQKLLLQTLLLLKNIKSDLKNEVIKTSEIDWDKLATLDELQSQQSEQSNISQDNKENNTITQIQTENNTTIKENCQEKQSKEKQLISINEEKENNGNMNNVQNIQSSQQTENNQNEYLNKDIQSNQVQNETKQGQQTFKEEELKDNKKEENERTYQKEEKKIDGEDEDKEEDEEEEEDDDDEQEDDENDGKQQSKFRRQTQCFIYRIMHKQ